MTEKFTDSSASRIIAALETRTERKLKNGAQTLTTWGTVGAIDTGNKTASAYIYGETDGAYMSEGFRIPEATYLTVGQKVKVAIDYATGDRWIDEVLYPSTAYKKIVVNLATGQILTGDGTVAPAIPFLTAVPDPLTVNDLSVLASLSLDDDVAVVWEGDARIRRTAARQLTIDDNNGGAADSALFITRGEINIFRAANTSPVLTGSVQGDSAPYRFSIEADGLLEWGPGGATRDVNLYRTGANTLRTDDDFIVGSATTASGSGLHVRAGGSMELVANAGTPYLDFKNDASEDFDARFILDSADAMSLDGAAFEISAGQGKTTLQLSSTGSNTGLTLGGDVTLYRAAANRLASDDTIESAAMTGAGLNDVSGTDDVTITTANTYYAIPNAEVSFTPSYVGQRFLILASYSAYANGTGSVTIQAHIRDGSNGAIDTIGNSRHSPTAATEWGPGAINGLWTADAVATRKVKLYATSSVSGRIISGAFYNLVALPLL